MATSGKKLCQACQAFPLEALSLRTRAAYVKAQCPQHQQSTSAIVLKQSWQELAPGDCAYENVPWMMGIGSLDDSNCVILQAETNVILCTFLGSASAASRVQPIQASKLYIDVQRLPGSR